MHIRTKSKESLKSLYAAFENLAKKMGREFREQISSKDSGTRKPAKG
ncbi:MAG: hypothetical protein RH860_10690 [Cytophagales bacterium]|nr:hypothetical protein HZR84_10490 [Hyphobacterium sp. CCMP332]